MLVEKRDVIDTLTKAKQNITAIDHPIGEVLKAWQETVIDALIRDVNDLQSPTIKTERCCANCKYYDGYCKQQVSTFYNEKVNVYECVCTYWTSEVE